MLGEMPHKKKFSSALLSMYLYLYLMFLYISNIYDDEMRVLLAF